MARMALKSLTILTGAVLLAAGARAAAASSPPATPPPQPTLDALFANPPAEARPYAVWHWRAGMSEADVADDLAWMKRTGFGGAMIAEADAIAAPALLARAAAEADRLSFELAVAPDFAALTPADGLKRLIATSVAVMPDGVVVVPGFDPALMVSDIALFAAPDGGEIAPASVIALTDKLRADGTLDWKPPALPNGQSWRIVRLGAAPVRDRPGHVDVFDGGAVRRMIVNRIERLRAAAGGLIGQRGIRALLVRPDGVGEANWTPQMIAQFRRLRGYDPTRWLPALAGIPVGSPAERERFLVDYRQTLAELLADEWPGMIAHVAIQRDLRVFGLGLGGGESLTLLRHADVPVATIAPGRDAAALMRGAASVARVDGQNIAAAVPPATLPRWSESPASLQAGVDLAQESGINRVLLHVTTDRPGTPGTVAGAAIDRNDPWADMAQPWLTAMARDGVLLQSGRAVADVGYVYGEERPLADLPPPADAPTQHGFDFLSPHALQASLINQGDEVLSPGGARYRVLYLGTGARRMTYASLRRLAELVEGGATVVGNPPTGNLSLAGDGGQYAALVSRLWPGSGDARVGRGRVIAGTAIDAAMARLGIAPQVRISGGTEPAAIGFVQRRLTDGESFFLHNRGTRAETVSVRFRVSGKAPELWHAATGKTEALSYRIEGDETAVPLTLAAGETAQIVFRKPAAAPALAIKKLVATPLATVAGPWTVAFQPGHGGSDKPLIMPGLAALDQSADPRLRHFAGITGYAAALASPRGWKRGQPLWLDLGAVGDLAEVTINGHVAGTVWRAPYRLEIGGLMKKGKNRLEVRVANVWANRLVGEGVMPAGTALRPAGLIGPVTLLGQGR